MPTRLTPPPIPPGFVVRPRLLEKLDRTFASRLALVSAPAGAGKTTLVSAWVQAARQQGAVVGWLSLDERDNTPANFLDGMVASLEEGGLLVATDEFPPWQGETPPLQDSLEEFAQALLTLKRETLLVLDDYNLIENSEIHHGLEYLLENAPPRLHLVMLTRSDPPLELARLRVAGLITDLHMEHLRFSTKEAAAFLQKSAGVQLSDNEIALLNNRTEGWIAGLQMAAISLRGHKDSSAFVAAFAGSHRYVSDYLLEQVLNLQTPELRDFLLKSSILDRLSAPLCDAVTGTDGAAQRLLDALERSNLFIIPLDDERLWFRYHNLFSGLLRLVLVQTYPGQIMHLHIRACRWFEEHGMVPEALHHALAAGNMELVARLVSSNVLALVEHAELAPVLQRMDNMLHTQGQRLPWLDVAHAWALAYAGQIERAGAALAHAEAQSLASQPLERQHLLGHIAAVRGYTYWVHGSQQQAIASAEQAARLLPQQEIAVRALNLTTLGNALTQYGADTSAVAVLEQALLLARQAGESHVFMLAATALVYAFISLGQIRRADQVCREAIENAETYQERTGQPLYASASAYAELGNILLEWGEIEDGLRSAQKGLALSERWGQADTMLLCLLNLSNGQSLAGDFQAASDTLQRARSIARRVSPWFMLNVEQAELRLWLDASCAGLNPEKKPELQLTVPASIAASCMLQKHQPQQALALLEHAMPEIQGVPSLERVRFVLVQAMVHQALGQTSLALDALEQALALAEPENLVSLFTRAGPEVEQLLRLALSGTRFSGFVYHLLTAFEARHKQMGQLPPTQTLIEPLSERELEVLELLNGPLSTPEIADHLIISVNTVRTHIKNIYTKLSAHGRSGAVRRAKELGLLV